MICMVTSLVTDAKTPFKSEIDNDLHGYIFGYDAKTPIKSAIATDLNLNRLNLK